MKGISFRNSTTQYNIKPQEEISIRDIDNYFPLRRMTLFPVFNESEILVSWY